MKILYVISTPIEYSSSANMRNIALIKGLMENGHKVDLLSDGYDINSSYVDKSLGNIKFRNRYFLRSVNNQEKETAVINNDAGFLSNLRVKLSRVMSKFSIYDNRRLLVNRVSDIKFKEKYDIIISSSDPKSSHLIAKEVIKKNPGITKKWIQYWGDPFAADINKKSIFPNFLIQKSEEKILKLADKVIYVSPFTLEKQKDLYPNYSDKMFFLPIPYLEEKIYKSTNNKEYTLGYFGDYNSKDRNILPLYDAVKELNLKLNVCGSSDLNLGETKKIKIMGRKPQSTIRELEEYTDLLVVVCNKKGTQIPGKVYHYAATNKPILIILDGDNDAIFKMSEYFMMFDRYELCNNSQRDIENAIKKMIDCDRRFMPQPDLSCNKIAKKFVNE